MKPLFGLIAGAILILSSCATSNEVNGGGIFQKRKYTKGFYWNRGGASTESALKVNEESLEEGELAVKTGQSDTEKPSSTIVTNANNNTEQTVAKATTKSEDKTLKSEGFYTKGVTENALVKAVHPIKKMAQTQSNIVKKTTAKAKAPRNNGQLGYLIGVVLLVILLLLLFTVLDAILGGLLSWILRIVILVVIIVLILRLLGVM